MKEHTVQSFSNELHNLATEVVELGEGVIVQLQKAVHATLQRDKDLASQVINSDSPINDKQWAIDENVVKLLALRQPISNDLRDIISALRCGIDLERIGDHSVNIARRSIILLEEPEIPPIQSISPMTDKVLTLLPKILIAFQKKDAKSAEQIWLCDDELNTIHANLFHEGLTYMVETPQTITPCTHFLFIAKNLERIGDHINNIAENIYYQVCGTSLRIKHRKPNSNK